MLLCFLLFSDMALLNYLLCGVTDLYMNHQYKKFFFLFSIGTKDRGDSGFLEFMSILRIYSSYLYAEPFVH